MYNYLRIDAYFLLFAVKNTHSLKTAKHSSKQTNTLVKTGVYALYLTRLLIYIRKKNNVTVQSPEFHMQITAKDDNDHLKEFTKADNIFEKKYKMTKLKETMTTTIT